MVSTRNFKLNLQSICAILAFAWVAADASSYTNQINLTFKDSSIVNDTVIRLKDIVANAKSLDAKVLETIVGEAAPAGFARFVGTQEVIGYTLKKMVANYRFSSDESKRISVRTDSKEITVEQFKSDLLAYINDECQWGTGNFTVDFEKKAQGSANVLKKPFTVKIGGLDTHFPRGHVALTISINQDAKCYTIPAYVRFGVDIPVVVAKTRIAKGELLTKENSEIVKQDVTHFAYTPYRAMNECENLRSNRTIMPGKIIHPGIVEKTPVIQKGDHVSIVYKKRDFSISIIGAAQEPGGLGDRIWVVNETSHKMIKTEVIGKNRVSVL